MPQPGKIPEIGNTICPTCGHNAKLYAQSRQIVCDVCGHKSIKPMPPFFGKPLAEVGNCNSHQQRILALQKEVDHLRLELKNSKIRFDQLRDEASEREEAAYTQGLADRAKVYAENQILHQTIAALVQRSHPLNINT